MYFEIFANIFFFLNKEITNRLKKHEGSGKAFQPEIMLNEITF
jgi:hypothetical protein